MTAFESRLHEIVSTSDTEAEQQAGLTLELIREVHGVRVLLVWMLVVVPAVLVLIGVIGAVSLAK